MDASDAGVGRMGGVSLELTGLQRRREAPAGNVPKFGPAFEGWDL